VGSGQVTLYKSKTAKLTKGEEALSGIVGGTMACWNHPFEVARIEMQSRADQGQGKVQPSRWALARTAHTRQAPDSPPRRQCGHMRGCGRCALPHTHRRGCAQVVQPTVERDGLIAMGCVAARHADEHGTGLLHDC
jgi:hypothetical protein